MVATGDTEDLAEWIIDDTCLVFSILQHIKIPWRNALTFEQVLSKSAFFKNSHCFFLHLTWEQNEILRTLEKSLSFIFSATKGLMFIREP